MDIWLEELCQKQGLTEVGVCKIDGGSVLVALFPYYAGECPDANLSRYAWSPDYHVTVRNLLTPIAEEVQSRYPDAEVEVLVDNHPLPERKLAQQAGLGFIGKNGCLIHPTYGSYVFIGLIRTTAILSADTPCEGTCLGCNACVTACPSNALEQGFDCNRCLSDLTQKRSNFTAEEETLFLRGRLIWGCDRCQEVCPHNQNLPQTPLKEFRSNLKQTLSLAELEPLSDRTFRRTYGDYAFAWRGRKPLLRNLLLKSSVKTLKEAIIVEGRYDQIKLRSVVNATIIPTNGFRIFSDPEKKALIRRLAAERGLVVLTDSDRGGFRIRGFLRGIVPQEQVKHAYIPELAGKEKRKDKPGKEGLLGVEGVPASVILDALRRAGCTFEDETPTAPDPFTRLRLYEDGLFGNSDSARLRSAFLKELGLPQKLTVSALLDLLNHSGTEGEYTRGLLAAKSKIEQNV